MSAEWKPGDVAMVSIAPRVGNDDPTEYVAFYAGQYGWYGVTDGEGCGGLTASDDNFYIHRRPLVVIDPEDREAVERFRQIASRLADWVDYDAEASAYTDAMQAALREFADPKPPRPEEPTGLGAVVEDEAGRKWIRTEWKYPWTVTYDEESGESLNYADITAVRILSPGVEVAQ